ncbi:L-lactate permease [Ammonifex thiophilus]|uniref:L-lactate permease n=1 Tax=Ammonifex thiophilus TaxID=444093 RepID=A0A3D8P4B5_9THEO|nr:L-lactate permease [Ammonifex thiophilus]RDV82492.1 L-lactate permease [Ammonifex thiophilus]
MAVFLTVLPVLLVLFLLLFRRWPVDASGLLGWVLTFIIACFYFHTPWQVALVASLAGLVASFPVSLMVAASIFQITFLECTGALKRIVVAVKTLARGDRAAQIMMLNMGVGTLLVAVGATPVSILPPVMMALGYSTLVAVALPALGFDSLCTYALLGAPLVIYADLTGTPLEQSARIFSHYMPIISTAIGFGMLWLVGGFKELRKGFLPCLLAGLTMGFTAVLVAWSGKGIVLTGVFAGLATALVMVLYLRLKGQPVIDRSFLTPADLELERNLSLLRALSPWLILLFCCLFINFYPPVFDYLFRHLAMPVHLIPGGKPILTRMLWNAYTWVIVSTLLALPFLRPSWDQWKEILVKWWRRAPRPTFSAAVFFAIAYVMNFSGFTPTEQGWRLLDPHSNMIYVLAYSSAMVFKSLYPAVACFLGLLGGFISGSEASTIALFAKYHLMTSEFLHVDALIVTAGCAVAAGLASVISPAKLQNAAATIDAFGVEGQVLRLALLLSIIMTALTAVLTWLWA